MTSSPRHRPFRLGPALASMRPDGAGGFLVSAQAPLGTHPLRLTARLWAHAEAAPERVFVAKRDASGRHVTLNYAGAAARAERIAAALLSRGLSAERPLMILSDNDLEHALLALGALHAGVPFVPISPAYSLLSTDFARLREAVRRLTPGLVFASRGAAYARAILAAIPSDTELVLTREASALDRASTPFTALERHAVGADVQRAHEGIRADSIAKFLLTSGSTGTPKAVIQTAGMLTSNLQMIVDSFPFLEDEPQVIVDWLPWHHTFGGNHNFGLMLYTGGSLYIDDGRPTPTAMRETLRNLREISPTVYFNVPRGLDELVVALERDRVLSEQFFRRIKLIFCAAAALSQRTWDKLEQLGEAACGERIAVATGIGMTETAPFALSANWLSGCSGGVGLPAPGVTLRLAPVGEKLEARYRGPSVTPGFWRAPELTRDAFDEQGFYRSGDALAFVDPDDLQRGFAFDGRIAEDFKLDSGTWVSVGILRAKIVAAGAPFVMDAVITGHDRRELGVLLLTSLDACRSLLGEGPLGEPARDAEAVLHHPRTTEHFKQLLARLARDATGSSTRITRGTVLVDSLSVDRGEITDKGSVVQQAVLRHHARLVERLYADDAARDPWVFLLEP